MNRTTEPQNLMQNHLDNLTKPKGSLGDLEDFSLRLSAIQKKVPPVINKKACFVFAGDHGVTAENVSLYPSEVTYQMVLNFLNGGAGVNVLSKHCGYDVYVVDAGVKENFDNNNVITRKAGKGTKNFFSEPAMTKDELNECLEHGKALAREAKEKGYDLVAIGDMGIGNTTTAAAMLIAAGLKSDDVVDRGTGIDEEMLQNKTRIINESVTKHGPYKDVYQIMQNLGGFELCTITGFILGLKELGIACVIDGFPVSSAAYMAYLIDNTITGYLFAGHKSKVKGHIRVLEKMNLKPIVDFNMRLGEGTGAVIGGFMLDLSAKIACEMATFASAGVSESLDEEENY